MAQQYNLAIQHYEQLKRIFLQRISEHLKENVANTLLNEENNKSVVNHIFSQDAMENTNYENIEKTLNEIFSGFGKILNEGYNLNQFTEYAKQDIKEEWQFIQEKLHDTQKEFGQNLQKYIQSLGKEKLRNFLINAIENTGSFKVNEVISTEERFTSLIDRVNILSRIWAESTILNGTDSYTINTGTKLQRELGGYIREDLAFQGLYRWFNEMSTDNVIKILPGGAKQANGKMIEMDNIIGFMNWIEKEFQGQMQIQDIYSPLSSEDRSKILNQIQYFGEQVKSFTISKIKAGQAGAHIGSREELHDQAVQYYKTPYLTLTQNANFMGRYGSILKALGPYNVFWTTGGGRQFTSDFIKEFHKQKLKLMFKYKDLDTASENNNQYPITNEIVLDRFADLRNSKQGGKRIGVYKKIRWS